jgi:hypothetical protein
MVETQRGYAEEKETTMSTTPLTLAELSKAQAEAEGFQNGPAPTLNPANLYVQDCLVGNPQTPGTPASTTPYYPSAETPNLLLTTDDMPAALANNFVLIDAIFPSGPGVFGVPVVQASLQVVNTTLPQTVTITAAKTTLYTVSIYMKALGTGGAGTTYTKTLTYTAADGSGVQHITLILPLDSSNVVMETYPILALAGTPVSTTGVFSGTPAPYTLSERIVQMP